MYGAVRGLETFAQLVDRVTVDPEGTAQSKRLLASLDGTETTFPVGGGLNSGSRNVNLRW